MTVVEISNKENMEKPNFALLIGKRLSDKDKGKPPDNEDHEQDLFPGRDAGKDDQKEEMENSAVSDIMAALATKNRGLFKSALKDFIQMSSSDDEDEQEPEPEPEPEPEEMPEEE
jgi:hypothetical protein